MHNDFIIACGGKVRKIFTSTQASSIGRGNKEEAAGAPSTARPKTFEQIREKHPNAYRPWSKEQDEELKKLFISGLKVADLIKSFGRKRGGIIARLEKLGLREPTKI